MADNNTNGKNTIEDVLQKFAEGQEGAAPVESPTAKKAAQLREAADAHMAQRGTLKESQEQHQDEVRQKAREAHLGFVEVPIQDLPSHGMFYPAGTKIFVRAASGGDIRKWSMLDETELQQVDNAINEILERCISISCADTKLAFKDLKEIDRLYLLLCVRDFTFTEGNNELKIDVTEGEQVAVKKDNISFIEIPEKMFDYYNEQKRCFVFDTDSPSGKPVNIYMPSVGVTKWLKEYIQRKSRMQEQFDQDFISIAPMLIKDYRDLNDKTYTNLVVDSLNWSQRQWAIISKVKTTMQKAVAPKVTIVDESNGGAIEKDIPLNFHGGLKSILLDTTALEDEFGF